jgi:hypothetical protein
MSSRLVAAITASGSSARYRQPFENEVLRGPIAHHCSALPIVVGEPDHLPRIPPPSGLFGMQAWRSVSFHEVLGMPQSPLLPGLTIWLWLGAARPIELVIEANDDRVEIGVYADRGNRVEIVVLAAEIVEVILDLSG